jgi:hypothetical protein
LLTERLAAWGEAAATFGQRLRQKKRCPGPEIAHLLGLQVTWSAEDIVLVRPKRINNVDTCIVGNYFTLADGAN